MKIFLRKIFISNLVDGSSPFEPTNKATDEVYLVWRFVSGQMANIDGDYVERF